MAGLCESSNEPPGSLKAIRYTLLDHKRNEDILQELNMQPLEEKIREYRNRWLEDISRMEAGRIPQEMLKYHPQGRRRRPGRPQKRLLDPV
ncbi:hypothetical protein ANN_14775 [Periplaneta americana]|uniref:Uncharacterized protein n=1 Tax=Periplaneta americana TaxID=6978 RepID=A0ABQ8SX72_PERAM|nr:hypothetical protein ANN_14775 [Periplaneta americana]